MASASLLLSMLAASATDAAGLGEIQTSSSLGQPFEARVAISATEDELSAARASLASEAAYEAAGLIRAPILDRFQVEIVASPGAPYLRISSRQHVGEPMLQLMVDLRTPGGTVRREYSVLLDPPSPLPRVTPRPQAVEAPATTAGPTRADAPPTATAAPAEPATPPAATAATPKPEAATVARGRSRPARSRPPAAAGTDRYGPVTAGETLGSIAERLRERVGGSFQFRVDAIRRANPGAFEPGRPGWLRLGAWLVIPGAAPGREAAASTATTPALAPVPAPIPTPPDAPSLRFRLADRLSALPPPGLAPATPIPAAASTPENAPAAAKPAVPASPPAAAMGGFRSSVRIVATGVLLLALALLLLALRRRREAAAQADPLDDEDLAIDAPMPMPQPLSARVPPPVATAEAVPAAAEPADPPPLPVEAVAEPAAPPAPAAPPPMSTIVSETPDADSAHGFYGEVAQLLLGALAREPARRDLRMKLLEVYYESRETELFHKHARLYLQSLEGRDDEHWPRIQAMGRELLPEAPLFTAQSRSALALAARPLRFYEHDLGDSLEPALQTLATEYRALHVDADFRDELLLMLAVIRPPAQPLAPIEPASGDAASTAAQVWCRWERNDPVGDAAHVNAYSQAFLAMKLGRETLITATRSGRHGIAVAAAAAELGLACRIYMHDGDHERHADSVRQMRALNASVVVVTEGAAPGDARTAALRDWLQAPAHALYISSLAAGPHPFPAIVRDFQALLGAETKAQVIERFHRRPLAVVVGRDDGPAAISVLQAFLDDRETALYCVDAEHPVPNPSYRREHSWLQHTGRVQYLSGDDGEGEALRQALAAQGQGLPPLGSARAAAFARRIAREAGGPGEVLVLMRREPGAGVVAAPLDLEIEPQGLQVVAREPVTSAPAEPASSDPAPPAAGEEPQLKPTIGLVRSRR